MGCCHNCTVTYIYISIVNYNVSFLPMYTLTDVLMCPGTAYRVSNDDIICHNI